jgi:hypothetical protein
MSRLRIAGRARLEGLTGADRDSGSVTVFMAIAVIGLLVLVGLVADGGAKLRSVQRADAIAAEAARAGGQAIDVATAAGGGVVRLDRQAAVVAATAYLAHVGETGTVRIGPGDNTLEVTVTATSPTVFLSIIGITQLTVTGHAQAALVHGVTGGGT